jgi:hypothetical protein
MIPLSKSALSACKGGVLGNSPHPVSTRGPLSPHSKKKHTEWPPSLIFGRGRNYAKAFQYAPDIFWDMVKSLRGIERYKLEENKLELGRSALEKITWKSQFPQPLPDHFVSAFVDAVRAKAFPKRRKALARFLGDSLGADGTVSARRSRDICGQERAKMKRATSQPEIYINCCGKKRWTVGQVCPECRRNLFATSLVA